MRKIFLMIFLLLGFIVQAQAQDSRNVSGTVLDGDGNPMIGVTVVGEGTNIGTVTDINGNYSLKLPNSVTSVKISYVGYDVVNVPIVGNIASVTLKEDAVALDEVIVTAMGITRETKTLGYGTAVVSGDRLTATRNTSAIDALNAKVPGLTISTASGAPGASTVANIRGFQSISGNNQPLYVVDGVPLNNRGNGSSTSALNGADDFNRSMDFGNQMNDINPNDIESMTVLKGSAASAQYGSRAANGVILITTKKGNSEKIRVDFNQSFGISDLLRLPRLQNTYGQGWSGLFAYEENGSWGPKADNQIRLWGNEVNNAQLLKPFSIQKDNLRDFFELGKSYTTDIALSNGNEKSNYRFSYGYANADGVVPSDADSYKRHTISATAGTKYKKFGINTSLNYVNKNQQAIATGQGDDAGAGKVVWQEIIQMPRDHSIVDYEQYNDPKNPQSVFHNLDNFFTPYAQNPYWTLYNQGNNYSEDRIYGNVSASYDIIKDLVLNFRGGLDASNAFQKDWGNLGIISDGSPNSSANDVVGSVSELGRNNQQLNSDIFLTYKRVMNENFDFDLTFGHNANVRKTHQLVSRVTNLAIPDYYNLSNTTSTPITETSKSERRLWGLYGQASMRFLGWVNLNVGARNDWTSTLPVENNSYFYPSASLSLVLSDAFDMPKQIDFLKLRTGIARTGNDADPYQVYPYYIPGDVNYGFGSVLFPLNGTSAYEIANNPGNLNLKPELTSEYEFGIELKTFANRIGLDLNYFNRKTKDQIINLLVDPASGFTNQTTNLGKVENKGIEMLLNLIPVKTKKFTWGVDFNFTRIRNEVLELGLTEETSILLNSSYDVDMRAEVGKPLGAIYAPQVATTENGQIIVNPTTGLPQLADDKEYMGSINPDYTMGFGTSLSAFGFTLGADADFRKGGVFYSYTARLNYFVGNAWNTQYNDREPWVIPNSVVEAGDGTYTENITPISRANVFTYYGATDSYQNEHVLPKTFFKLRNLYLNYTIPSRITQKAKIQGATVGLFGRNLMLWTPSENHFVDPESNTFGTSLESLYGEFSTGPSSCTYGVQLNLTF